MAPRREVVAKARFAQEIGGVGVAAVEQLVRARSRDRATVALDSRLPNQRFQ